LKILSQRIPFDEKQMSSNGFGKTKPIADNSNYQGRALNRRVVITAKFTEQSDQQMTK
jgi:outer membrane protein OmpA-like peptidoglycan-associated protein